MKKEISISCVGQGFVGGSLATGFGSHYNVFVYDKLGKCAPKAKFIGESIEELITFCYSRDDYSNVCFVAVPTPMNNDGSCNIKVLNDVLEELDDIGHELIVVIKSTIPPGTTECFSEKFENLKLVFNPEYLTEANALEDFINQDRIILGSKHDDALNIVTKLYSNVFPNAKIVKTTTTQAEMAKYMTNVFLATKVSLANEFYQICSALNVDYDETKNIAILDKRLGESHWMVPGPMLNDLTKKPSMGFAGSCFIKDLNALIHEAKKLEVDPKVMNAVWEKNLEVRPERDWELLKGRAISYEIKSKKEL